MMVKRSWLIAGCLAACNVMPSTSSQTSAVIGPPPPIRYPRGLFSGVGTFDPTWLLGNDALSGLTVWAGWKDIEPDSASVQDWSKFDAVFDAVTAWNSANPFDQKYVKIGVNGGFATPSWVLADLTDCDTSPSATCGKATFTSTEGPPGTTGPGELPLPWNATYQKHWATFIGALAARYGSNPALVAVSISGPGATSNELMAPTGKGAFFTSNLAEWEKVIGLTLPTALLSDQVFVQPWETAIDLYGSSFTNITLVVTTGASFSPSGFPLFGGNCVPMGAGFAEGQIDGINQYCASPPNMDCAAETQILAYFIDPTVGGNNAKATDMDGMYLGCDQNLSLGLHGVKLLTTQTQYGSKILGGTAYISPITDDGQWQGCTTLPCPPAQAMNGVMSQAFKNTAAATSYSASQDYIAPLNYVEVFPHDVQWATPPTGSTFVAHPDMQTQLELAATSLATTAEAPNEPVWTPPPPPGGGKPM